MAIEGLQMWRSQVKCPQSTWQEDDNKWTLPIVIHDTAHLSDSQALSACARSVIFYLDQLSEYSFEYDIVKDWLRSPIRKVVRHGRGKWWSIFTDVAGFVLDDCVAVAAPYRKDNPPRIYDKLQVSGLEYPRDDTGYKIPTEDRYQADIGVISSISTGKACAQAAHAAQLFALSCDEQKLSLWRDSDFAIYAHRQEHIKDETVFVADNGLTEVAPDTITAFCH